MLKKFWNKSHFGKVVIVGLAAALAGVIFIVGFVLSIKMGAFGDLPTAADLKKIENNQAALVYSADGKILGKYFVQERTNIKYKDLSPDLVHALVATEDARFFEHDGVDYRAWARVFVKTLLLGNRSSGGGSTLTQQLAKNLFPRAGGSKLDLVASKIKEVIIARTIEDLYTKEEIINLYLNTVPFGDNSYGIQTASRKFFSCEPKDLSTQDAAVLIGMLKANYYYNPRVFPDHAFKRRNIVLSQMQKYNYLTLAQEDSLQRLPLKTKYRSFGQNTGIATYFREQLRRVVLAKLDSINEGFPKEQQYDLYRDGLKIYTTIDSRMQTLAEEAMKEHMVNLQKSFNQHWKGRTPWKGHPAVFERAKRNSQRYKSLLAAKASPEQIEQSFATPVNMEILTDDYEKKLVKMSPNDSIKHYLHFLNMGMVAMEPQTGDIKVYIGGVDHEHLKIDHASKYYKRQVGSTLKPLVYATALEQGAKACDYYPVAKQHYLNDAENGWHAVKPDENGAYPEDTWAPGNADGKYDGYYSMKGALTNSVNTVSVQVELEAGLDNVATYLKRFGISGIEKMENDEGQIPPSTVLGTPQVSIQEMVSAYSALANGGYKVSPRFLTKIVDGQGNVLYENEGAGRGDRIIKSATDHQILAMMKSVVNQGTGSRLRRVYGLNNELAGKTGTTQSNTDGWFMGVSPRLVVGTWVGNDEPAIRWRSTRLGQGANTALPIFGKFMQKMNRTPEFGLITKAQFPALTSYEVKAMNCADWVEELPNDNVVDTIKDLFKIDPIKQQERKERREEKAKTRKKKKRKGFFRKLFGKD